MSATAPLISVVLFTKTVVLYSGLVADVAALVCFRVRVTVRIRVNFKLCYGIGRRIGLSFGLLLLLLVCVICDLA